MEIHPGFKVAIMGSLAYIGGVIVKGNSLNLAVTWAVAEIAALVFLKLYKGICKQLNYEIYDIEYPVRLLVGSVACVYLSDHEKVTKVIQAVTALSIFSILPDILNHLEWKKPAIRIL